MMWLMKIPWNHCQFWDIARIQDKRPHFGHGAMPRLSSRRALWLFLSSDWRLNENHPELWESNIEWLLKWFVLKSLLYSGLSSFPSYVERWPWPCRYSWISLPTEIVVKAEQFITQSFEGIIEQPMQVAWQSLVFPQDRKTQQLNSTITGAIFYLKTFSRLQN